MRIGFNFTLGATLDMVQRMVAKGQIDYCELLIDNFLHVPPAEISEAFNCPLAFHIMLSKFIETDVETLKDLAQRLRVYIDALNPIYVSDHVARFTHNGRHLYHLGEIDYRSDYDQVRRKTELWQSLLGQQLYLENYPSIMDGGWDAPEFHERLQAETGAGVLFDASNAVCALLNCAVPLDAWNNIIRTSPHFHVSSYRPSMIEPFITLDMHDGELSPETLAFLASQHAVFDKPGATITYERDDNLDEESIVADLETLRRIFPDLEREKQHEPRILCVD
jgi:uncharacterized protein